MSITPVKTPFHTYLNQTTACGKLALISMLKPPPSLKKLQIQTQNYDMHGK
jgi:hypothetical protein